MDDFFDLLNKISDNDSRDFLMKDPKNLLLFELFLCELQARKGGKRKTYDTHNFEVNLMENLMNLRDAVWEMEYKPSRSTAHIINDPVKREIFAAPYVDRVMHHWVVNTLAPWWEKRLSYDAYSCRVGKGTLFGVKRLRHHMAAVSHQFTLPIRVVKIDISGYFMHINRKILYERVQWGLDKQFEGNYDKRYKMLKHAIYEIIFDDPTEGVRIQGSYEDWRGLPANKSLFCQDPGDGMVIGNYSSQFFSNIYLDPLNRFIRNDLGYKHSGQYVDDVFIVVPEDRVEQLKRDLGAIRHFLEGLHLEMNAKKTKFFTAEQGVPFLGSVVRKNAILPDKRLMHNLSESLRDLQSGNGSFESIVSYLGLMKHINGHKATKMIFEKYGLDYGF